MADVSAAIEYVLRQEDESMEGVITSTPDGKRTRYGIDEHYHHELTSCMFYSKDMSSTAALIIARKVYVDSYADPLCIADMHDQALANKLLSLGVNIGVKRIARMLQASVQDSAKIDVDGRIGPLTLHAMEMYKPEELLERIEHRAVEFYEQDVAEHPEKRRDLKGWLRRANA